MNNPTLTKELIHRIAELPEHRHVRSQARALVVSAIFGAISVVTAVATSIGIGKRDVYLRYDLWLEYLGSLLLVVVGLFFSAVTYNDVRTLQDPIQLELDICRVALSNGGTIALLVLLFVKKKRDVPNIMQECGNLPPAAMVPDWCVRRLGSLKADTGFVVAISILGATTIFQIILFVLLFRNKLVNPPPAPAAQHLEQPKAPQGWRNMFVNSQHDERHASASEGKEPLLARSSAPKPVSPPQPVAHSLGKHVDVEMDTLQAQSLVDASDEGNQSDGSESADENWNSDSSADSSAVRRHLRTMVSSTL
ncbi:hypothetical protein ACM66B_001348 [Microbotryomycetes sp. NB124-2]